MTTSTRNDRAARALTSWSLTSNAQAYIVAAGLAIAAIATMWMDAVPKCIALLAGLLSAATATRLPIWVPRKKGTDPARDRDGATRRTGADRVAIRTHFDVARPAEWALLGMTLGGLVLHLASAALGIAWAAEIGRTLFVATAGAMLGPALPIWRSGADDGAVGRAADGQR